jgi:hypothetical protein
MALQSPGVEVTVIDESFYTPAEPGTTPLIVVATAQNKKNAAGSDSASGTLKENAGKAFRMTSQKDVIDFFGVPFFEKTATGNPIHGGERNEYGLLTAYSLLGVTNSAFIVRADVDLDQLVPQSFAPGSQPDDGQWWVDTGNTAWGIKEWNGAAKSAGGQRFVNKTPIVLTDDDISKLEGNPSVPKESVGSIGDYAVVYQSSVSDPIARIYYKSQGNAQEGITPGTWVLIGSDKWSYSWPTAIGGSIPEITSPIVGTITINGSPIVFNSSTAQDIVTTINSLSGMGINATLIKNSVYLYTSGDIAAADSSQSDKIVLEDTTPGTLAKIGFTVGQSGSVEFYGPKLQKTPHTQVPTWKNSGPGQVSRPTGSVWINTTEPNGGARWRVRKYSVALQAFEPIEAPIYRFTHEALFFLDRSGGGLNLPVDTLFAQSNAEEDDNAGDDQKVGTATFKLWRRAAVGPTVIKSVVIEDSTFTSGTKTFRIWQSIRGERNLSAYVEVSFIAAASNGTLNAGRLATAINSLSFVDGNGNTVVNQLEASVTDDGEVQIIHKTGGDIRFAGSATFGVGSIFPTSRALPALATGAWIASNWEPLSVVGFAATRTTPINEPQDGQLWYSPEFSQVDIMVHDGDTWTGYRSQFPLTDPAGPAVSAAEPTTQSDGTALEENDLWISTADLENFPIMYRYDKAGLEWVQIDTTDQVTEDGILFADARYGSSGATGNTAASIKELLTNDYLDPDAPDPALYPRGMLLWNTRRSGGNVKRYANNYIDTSKDNLRYDPQNTGGESMSAYATDRWVTASPNNENGSGSFGRKAQRGVVVRAMKSVIDTSQEIRDTERRNFNIIAAPGYPELLSNLINLNLDRGLLAFVIGDTPLRLRDDATSLINWGTNARLVLDNGDDGIVSFDEYAAVYYPNGFTTDLSGSNAVVPASHMMLRTITLSDQASYPWFAPAGTRRGGITNATAVGYIDSRTGEFQTIALNEGQRDVLYDLKVNPIPFFVGVGLVAYGQKTRARNASALDRINVARLVVYLRSQLNKLARPYIFEPNDKLTRDEVKQAVESLLLELVGLRAIFDFAVVCDESNNTPSRIDRNELWVDIAIEPVKAVEFIYIPLRVKNTGEI